jgi:hypothetical protein
MSNGDDIVKNYDTNDGSATVKLPRGGQLVSDFARDDSNYAGTADEERGGGMGGSVNNLAHSLTGAKANMSGEPS